MLLRRRHLACLLPLVLAATACGGGEPVLSAEARAAHPAKAAPADARTATPWPTSTEGLAEVKLAEDLVLRELGPGVHLITHAHPWAANALLVEMANGDLVLCDPTYTVDAMRRVLAWIDGHHGKRRIVAISTHFHIDRVGGNGALVERGIPVYGADLTLKMLAERGDAGRRWLRESLDDKALIAEFEAQPTVAPDHPFPAAEGLTLRFGEEQVVVHYPGPGHAPDNVVVVFPERGILFGGCLVAAGERIGNKSDADMARWGDSVRSLHRFKPRMVIPGHGERLDPGLLDHTLKLLAAEQGG